MMIAVVQSVGWNWIARLASTFGTWADKRTCRVFGRGEHGMWYIAHTNSMESYYSDCHGIVFMIDSTDRDRLEECRGVFGISSFGSISFHA